MEQQELEKVAAQQQIAKAIERGIEMLSSDDISTPNSWNNDLSVLQNILGALSRGELVIMDVNEAAALREAAASKPDVPPEDPPPHQ